MKSMRFQMAKAVLLAAMICASVGAVLGHTLDILWHRHRAR